MSTYRSLTALLALLTTALGLVMLVLTLSRGGGMGILLGLLFVAAGGGRLYVMRRRR